jgi:hypothetical protein
MAKFAPVAPIQVVSKMDPLACGDYHLLLAHDVADKAQEYRRFFGSHQNFTVIMDNSVIELGGAVDLKTIRKACEAVDSTTVVLPDVLLDAKATVEQCTAALGHWPDTFRDLFGTTPGRRGFMIVPQGRTLAEFAWCASQFASHPDINFWGVPRNLVKEVGSRERAIDIVSAINPHRRIHMLGFSDDMVDDVLVAKDRRVEGIDSAVPIRCGTLGIELGFASVVPPRDPSWFETAEYVPLMDENVMQYRAWIRRN